MRSDQSPEERSGIDDQADCSALPQSPRVVVAWTLRKGDDSAQCVLCPADSGIDLHIRMNDAVIVSQRSRGPEQAAFVSDTWYAALTSRGWH